MSASNPNMPKTIEQVDSIGIPITMQRIDRFEAVDPHNITNGVSRLFFDAMCDLCDLEECSMDAIYADAAIQNDELYLGNYEGYTITDGNAVYIIRTIAINDRNETAYCVFADDGNTDAWYTIN